MKNLISILTNKRVVYVLTFSFITVLSAYSQRIVGYTTSWSGNPNQINYDQLTHINYSFALPNASGTIQPVDNPSKLNNLVNLAHNKGVKVLIAIGGWDLGDGGGNDNRFNVLASTASGRNTFVNSVLSFIDQYHLDGADIDWEFPEPVNGAPDNNFTALMNALSSALHSRGLLLTAAVNGQSWAGDGISPQVFGYVDWLNIMAYDGDGGAGHSPYSYAQNALNYYKGRGLPANKAVVGVPFYARPSWNSYSTLLAQGADPYSDYFNGDYYNGINTIKSKTKLAKEQGGGIMIWSIDHDVQGQYSLLKAIKDEMGTVNPPPPSGNVTVYKHCNYDGSAVSLGVGDYNLGQLQSLGVLNDDVSSIRINNGYEVTLYWDDNFQGSTVKLTADNSCLVSIGWNDKVSSMKVATVGNSFSKFIEAEQYNAMSGIQTEACSEGGQNVGWIDSGDWMAFYNVNFPSNGNYNIEYRVASPSGSQLSADLNAGSIQLGAVNIPSTGGWQNWTTVSHTVNINAGTYNFGLFAPQSGWNINWIRITKVGNTAPQAEAMEIEKPEPLETYPNPAEGELNIVNKDGELDESQMVISNSQGRVVYDGPFQSNTNILGIPGGIYSVKIITSDGKLRTSTFLKQ